MKNHIILLLICFNISFINAQLTNSSRINSNYSKFQKIDNKPKKSLFKKRILPISLIASGILLSTSDFEKSLQKDLRSSVGDDFHFKIDDYTRYAPVVQLYAADILGVPSRNHWFDQTKNLMLSTILTGVTTTIIKKETYKERPGESTQANSFPSGHTSIAFSSASVLYEEFIDTKPLLAYSGYFFAITTAGMRMLNNKHFLSDVLVGAGIGILSTKLVYHFDHLISWNPFKKMDGIAFTPQYDGQSLGFYFSRSF
ncbi:phosphatase PAP2 family protein [Aquimarina sp. RZ0]|uniref:phosphatase PAP2 family protein n=1 Tax=Aquimarina sp. RZ0 TaxID=2607730 RepID=UPI0011F28B2C|nr:phosphatase PAP2 family protein [Aquimarina sp. RZ0]KAA1242748.1 phosphatase PAP2 family protein [Aquimarina sp. RZ0]